MKNFYDELPTKYRQKKYFNPNKLVPQHPYRLCVIGASNTGKTNVLMNIIEQSKNFHKIYLYAKKINEPLYQCFIDVWLKRSQQKEINLLEYSNDFKDTIDIKDINETIQNLVIFDDMVTESNLDRVSELFIRGRKSNCSMIFITQSYFDTPTQVRVNSDYFIFTRNLQGNQLTQVAKDQSGFLSIDEFKELYRAATTCGYDFFMIDLQSKEERFKFRMNFDYSLVDRSKL